MSSLTWICADCKNQLFPLKPFNLISCYFIYLMVILYDIVNSADSDFDSSVSWTYTAERQLS